MYYEIVHAEPDRIWTSLRQRRLTSQDTVCYRFQSRIFIKASSAELSAIKADFEDGYQLKAALFEPADWFFSLIKLTQHYPAAHRQLQIALANNASVEVFASNLAWTFCYEWKSAKNANSSNVNH